MIRPPRPVKHPCLAGSGAFSNQESTPPARDRLGCEEDCVICHQRKGLRWRCTLAGAEQRVIERESKTRKLLTADQRDHCSASFNRWSLAWLLLAEETELMQRRRLAVGVDVLRELSQCCSG